ncbi:MAG TPA: threonine dehydratase [Steroidobacteraceae bacterium]|nr:threonine dehydratase [Steroidobacteraceae bacterium]
MSEITFELTELQQACELVHGVLAPTPQYPWPKLARRAGCTVWVKHENHTPTGAFKVRGGLVYLHRLRELDPQARGVITATRGNHGQSIAFAAARAGIPAAIYVPCGNSPDQNSSIAAFGASVVEFGGDFDEAKHEAHRVARAQGWHFVPAFHRALVLGVASYALELFGAAGPLDAVYVGVGMGSGISALIAVRDALGLSTDIIAVGAANAPATALSYAAGRPVAGASARTFADGLATREPHPEAIAAICAGAARMVQVGEDAIAEAMRIYYDDTHQIAEGAGAAPLAGLLQERARMAGKRVALILSGGNIERARFRQVLGGDTPAA